MTAAAGILSVLLVLTLQIPGGQAGAQPVAGLLHHSVELYYRDLLHPAVDITWESLTQKKIKIVTNHKGHKTIYKTQFTERVEISNNGTKLHIKDLRMEDTGVYLLTIAFTDGETRDVRYNLTVYEPISPPSVATVKENATDRCNVTLHCSVSSNTSDQSYTWIYRQRNGHYQLFKTGSTIQISLPPDHQDMEFLCVVRNPADQKNVSVTLEFCSSKDLTRHLYILSIIPVIFLLMAGTVFIVWKRRKKQTEIEYCMPEDLSTEPSTSISQVFSCDEVSTDSNLPHQRIETLYTLLDSKT